MGHVLLAGWPQCVLVFRAEPDGSEQTRLTDHGKRKGSLAGCIQGSVISYRSILSRYTSRIIFRGAVRMCVDAEKSRLQLRVAPRGTAGHRHPKGSAGCDHGRAGRLCQTKTSALMQRRRCWWSTDCQLSSVWMPAHIWTCASASAVVVASQFWRSGCCRR